MKTLIKICGLSTPATLEAALAAGADMIGLVHFPPSPRHVDVETARNLAEAARGRAAIVVLTVDAQAALLDRLADAVRPDLFQFHGAEPPQTLERMRAKGFGTIKALGVKSAEDLALAAHYAPVSDFLLLDAKPPKEATRPGGLGQAFDWSLIDQLDRKRPLMLSGGLNADTVGEAIARVRPEAVDVSSGVESAPGVKAPEKIKAFVEAARQADAAQAGAALPTCRESGQTR